MNSAVPVVALMMKPAQTQGRSPIIDFSGSFGATPSTRRSISMMPPTRNDSPM
jgi:hypothetical protein